MIGVRLTCLAGGAAAIVLLGIAPPVFGEFQEEASPRMVQAARAVWTQADRVYLAQSSKSVDRAIIREIQKLLADHGLDPGPADGNLGPKTNSAIIRYQKSAGLVTDGRPSRELLDHLRKPAGNTGSEANETSEAAPVAGVEAAPTTETPPPPPPPLPPVPTLTDTVWRFVDETGSTFTLTFAPSGAIEGVLYVRFWSWRQFGDDVTIFYNNGMGRHVTRTGTLTDPDTLSGTATASRSSDWAWTAKRVRGDENSGAPVNQK